MANIGYPLDVVGNATTNRIVESRTLSKQVEDGRALIVPKAAPFFVKDLSIKTKNKDLILGVDYVCVLKSFEYTQLCAGNEIVGGIIFNSLSVGENVTITYQTLGGDYNVPVNNIIEDTTRLIKNPNFTTFSQVVDTPAGVVPYSHKGEFGSTEGYDSLIKQIELLSLALGGGTSGSGDLVSALLAEHIKSKSAHSKESVGLNNVQNYPLADNSDFDKVPYTNQKYTTPLTVMYAINLFIGDKITEVENSVTQLGKTVSGNNDSYAKLKNSFDEVNKSLAGINNTYNIMTSALGSYEDAISSYKILNDEIEKNQKSWLNALNDINVKLTEYSKQYTEFTNSKESLLSNMKSLENSYNENNNKVNEYLSQIDAIVGRLNNIEDYKIYQKTKVYTSGSHSFKLKPNESITVTLIGAGGASGSYTIGEYNPGANYNGEHGKDTTLWCFQDPTNGQPTPIETPIICAGGGFGGSASCGNEDGSTLTVVGLGGRGGEFTYLKNENLLIVKEASKGDGGLKATAGKGNVSAYVNQQLGYENFGKMFGRGGFKSKAVGAGGEGALVKAKITNPYKVDLEFCVNVGERGRSTLSSFEEALGGLVILEKS